jgi:predicted RNase H-like nuclease (RuvC/YqgF family)
MVLHPFQKRAREEAKKKAAEEAKLDPVVTEVKKMSKKNPSRRERFEHVQSLIADALAQTEELKGELEEWKDNLPENLQNGSKAQELEDAISNLDELIDALNTAEGVDVDFPGAFGR